ncbi:unnamed protein product [Arctia plantaginis]|uniref:WAP domain-containing protein n=1 Tax=Arctia plantaginis TaxID=874455 RepID=A0A8S0ZAP0_ARCPL|nr:unnamed protein product [Arctia plantaginis]CAB3249627.1 unnamed protein product [Arctia plantaginis]
MGFLNRLLYITVAVLILGLASGAAFNSGICPPKNKVYNDKPTCFSDADCQKYGKICCPNQYNTKSCTDRSPYFQKSFKKTG